MIDIVFADGRSTAETRDRHWLQHHGSRLSVVFQAPEVIVLRIPLASAGAVCIFPVYLSD
jgi:hypothetical protein